MLILILNGLEAMKWLDNLLAEEMPTTIPFDCCDVHRSLYKCE